jgi:hypothetical protein
VEEPAGWALRLGEETMATEFCQKCKQAHPGRACDYDDKGECAETVDVNKDVEASTDELQDKNDAD